MIKKFKVNVVRESEFVIEIDTAVCNEAFLENYSRYFHEIDDYAGHAENIGEYLQRNPDDTFIEGYGYITVDGRTTYGQTAGSGITVTRLYDEVADTDLEEI